MIVALLGSGTHKYKNNNALNRDNTITRLECLNFELRMQVVNLLASRLHNQQMNKNFFEVCS
jgi:hypothetical protein